MTGHTHREILTFASSICTLAATNSSDPYPDTFIKTTLIQLSNYLIGVTEQPTLFGRPAHDPHRPSLRTLHDRLHIGRIAPSPITKDNTNADVVKQTLGKTVGVKIEARDLKDFEDMYYALIARMQEMRQTLNTWLASSFMALTSELFDGGPTLTVFHATLDQFWTLLHDACFVAALDNAVRAYRLEYTTEQIKLLVENGEIGIEDAEPCLRSLCDNWDTLKGIKFEMLAWSPAMIAVYLEGRYKVVLGLEKEVAEKHARGLRKRAKMRKSVEDFKARRGSKRGSGSEGVLSERRASKENHRSPVIKSGPAKAVRFTVDPRVMYMTDKATAPLPDERSAKMFESELVLPYRGSVTSERSLQIMNDYDDYTAMNEQRAYQASLHRDIERQLHLEASRCTQNTTGAAPPAPRQQSFDRIDDVRSWEHMTYAVLDRDSDAMEY